jgi:hypothetical protein
MRSASPSRSNLSRHICGPAKSQGRSASVLIAAVTLSAYLLLTRSRCGPGGAELGGLRTLAGSIKVWGLRRMLSLSARMEFA